MTGDDANARIGIEHLMHAFPMCSRPAGSIRADGMRKLAEFCPGPQQLHDNDSEGDRNVQGSNGHTVTYTVESARGAASHSPELGPTTITASVAKSRPPLIAATRDGCLPERPVVLHVIRDVQRLDHRVESSRCHPRNALAQPGRCAEHRWYNPNLSPPRNCTAGA